MKSVIGIDEVGRGCWAGPLLVVAARASGKLPQGLADSKKLTKKQRELLYFDIKIGCEVGEGWVSAAEIDKHGLTRAMEFGVDRALKALGAQYGDEIIMDGTINYCDPAFTNVTCKAKADDLYPIVSAASIYAKVCRDNLMTEEDRRLPQYGFCRHVGYGTAEHIQALKDHGISELHRLSFTPIRALAGG